MRMENPHQAEIDWLERMKFTNRWVCAKPIEGDRFTAVCPFMATFAIITGTIGNEWSYDDRWCYHTDFDAIVAYALWDGAKGTEPTGWHRHPPSGRRLAEGPGHFDEEGREVPEGEIYVRH